MASRETIAGLGINPDSTLGRSMMDSEWAPNRGTSLSEFHRIHDALEERWHSVLADRVAAIDGLNGRYLEYEGRAGNMPWVWWTEDTRGGYWVGHGLEHRLAAPPDQLRGWHWLSYLRNSPDGERFERQERVGEVWYEAPYATDLELHADVLAAWLLAHRRTL